VTVTGVAWPRATGSAAIAARAHNAATRQAAWRRSWRRAEACE
jgi:hypothetical protein